MNIKGLVEGLKTVIIIGETSILAFGAGVMYMNMIIKEETKKRYKPRRVSYRDYAERKEL